MSELTISELYLAVNSKKIRLQISWYKLFHIQLVSYTVYKVNFADKLLRTS